MAAITKREQQLLDRITVNPDVFGGKPIIRGRRLAVEHVMAMLDAGDTDESLLQAYPWLERDDIAACRVANSDVIASRVVHPPRP
jgi:uncharacterized protein (DUF433 family)